jgi:hypothetical protein
MNILNLFKRKKPNIMEAGKRYVIFDAVDGNCEVEVLQVSASGKMALIRWRTIPMPDEWLEIQQQEILDSV